MSGEWGWRLHWQDFRGHQVGDKPPKKFITRYGSKEAAEAAKAMLPDGIVCTITPQPPPKSELTRRERSRMAASALPLVLPPYV